MIRGNLPPCPALVAVSAVNARRGEDRPGLGVPLGRQGLFFSYWPARKWKVVMGVEKGAS